VKNPNKKFFGGPGGDFSKKPPGRRGQERGAAAQMKPKKTRPRDKQPGKRVNPYKGLKSYEEGDSENQLPGFLRERLLKGEREFPFSVDRPNARLIISLREHYVPHLIQLKSRIPSIDRVMFRVVHLHGKQAREVIGMPGGIQDPQVARDILRRFYPEGTPAGKTIPDEKLEIEPAFLSLLCYQLFAKQELRPIIKEDLDRVLVDFYGSVMKPYPAE
jgi:hypothetical protein